MVQFFPFIFVILWSSAFVTGKIIVENSSPFLALFLRFTIVAFGFMVFSIYIKEKIISNFKDFLEAFVIGIFFHGFYLGGVFFAASQGFPVGITALIVSLQPILTCLLAGPLLKEKIVFRQWFGILLGFIGTAIVIGLDLGEKLQIVGFVSSVIALLGVTIGTLWQKRISGNLSLSVNNFYQALGASIFHFSLVFTIENAFLNFTNDFLLAMSWQIIAVSFGAFSILMYMLRVGTASKTVTLFFLVPPTTSLMSWFFLGEFLTKIDILGLVLTTFGVYIATRENKSKLLNY